MEETKAVSLQKAMEVLKDHELHVTEDQGRKILEFLSKFANIVVSQCIKEFVDGDL
jgi:DNA-directed RNA polymerase subunit F